jgi:hypothetical protein
MKAFFVGGIALVLLAPIPALAQSPFDGTWKADVKSANMGKKPDVYSLQNGMYACKSCVPAVSVKADGTDHAVTGHPYYDSEAVKVVDDHPVQFTRKKNGKVVDTSKDTVSADGKTLTFEFSDSSNTSAAPVVGKGTQMRVAAGLAGAHAISGSWRTTSYESVSDNGLTTTFKTDGDMLTMTVPTGQKYTAKMDGTEAPFTGDPGLTMVSVKKMGANKIQETDKRGSKVIGVQMMTVSADGKKMHVVYQNKEQGTSMSYEMDKQ